MATECDQASHRWARQIVRINRQVAALIEGRHQPDPLACFANVTRPGERFAACMCNPPFHASAAEAAAGSARKRRNLQLAPTAAALNFGGAPGELWCDGGEVGFIERMIAESAGRPQLCFWFTTLVSNERAPAATASRAGASSGHRRAHDRHGAGAEAEPHPGLDVHAGVGARLGYLSVHRIGR